MKKFMEFVGGSVKKIPLFSVEISFSIAGYLEKFFLRTGFLKYENQKPSDKGSLISKVRKEVAILKPFFVLVSLSYLFPLRYFILSLSFELVFSLIFIAFVVRRVLTKYGVDPEKEKQRAIEVILEFFKEYYPDLLKSRGKNLFLTKNSVRTKISPTLIKISESLSSDVVVEKIVDKFEEHKLFFFDE